MDPEHPLKLDLVQRNAPVPADLVAQVKMTLCAFSAVVPCAVFLQKFPGVEPRQVVTVTTRYVVMDSPLGCAVRRWRWRGWAVLTYASPDAHLSWRATPVAEHRERPQRQPFVGVAAGTQSDSDEDAAIGCRDWVWDAATGPVRCLPLASSRCV